MPEGLDYALGSIGGLLGLFGVFLLFYERFQYCAGGCRLEPRTRAAAWSLLLLGAVLVAAVIALRPG